MLLIHLFYFILFYSINYLGGELLEKNIAHKKAMNVQNFLTGFDIENPNDNWIKLIADTSADIFIHFNIQFNHLLNGDSLHFSWDKLIFKIAKDSIFRVFNGLEAIKSDNMNHQPKLNKSLLIDCFLEGKSDGGLFSMATNKARGGKLNDQYKTEKLIEKPSIKKDGTIFSDKDSTIHIKEKYYYRYCFQHEDPKKFPVIQELSQWNQDIKDISNEDLFIELSNKKKQILEDFFKSLLSKESKFLKNVLSNQGYIMKKLSKLSGSKNEINSQNGLPCNIRKCNGSTDKDTESKILVRIYIIQELNMTKI